MSQMTSTARVGARALNRPATTTPRLRVVTGAPLRRGDAAFGIVCAILLAAGLIGLLLLNTALAQGSFTLHDLQATSDQLTDAQAALNQSVDASRSPANLAARAVSMGMVPAQSPAFLRLSDGKVIGVATPASSGPGYTVVPMTASAPAPVVAKPVKPAAPVVANLVKPPAPVVAKPVKPPAPVVAKPVKPAPVPAAKRPAKPATR
jgi:hypothetical protein